MLYFGYGSNLSSERMRGPDRCPGARFAGIAVLRGYRLAFDKPALKRWGGNAANIRPEAGAETWGALWEVEDGSDDLRRLDAGERGYARVAVEVECEGEPVPAQAYLAPPGREEPPPAAYLEVLLRGAREHGLPAAYTRQLALLRTREDVP